MTCPECNAMPGQGECAKCRALAGELRANAEALSALRHEELPPLVVTISKRAPVYPWVAAAAAAVLLAMVLPTLWHTTPQAEVAAKHPAARHGKSEPLKIKMLTPDPDVVIYWLIDSREGE